jgi:hypothetical protein
MEGLALAGWVRERHRSVPALAAIVAGMTLVASPVAPAQAAAIPTFSVGAATADIDPPLFKALSGPWNCDPTGYFNGPHKFAFEEPYKDKDGNGQYEVGEPFLDCNHDGRYDGIFIWSGGNQNATQKDPIEARALVVSNGRKKIAVEVVDSIGIFNTEMDLIRSKVRAKTKTFDEIFISSTHDESSPDPIGLAGPSGAPGGVPVSGVSKYYLDFMAQKGADAILKADSNRRAARIRYAQVEQPRQFQTCFSSYPYVQDRKVRVLQAVDVKGGTPIVTLSNYGIHAETMAFSPNPAEGKYMSADWPHFERAKLDKDLGGVSIHMAGAVGSVETPRVFTSGVTSAPTKVQHPDHPADCHTTDSALDPNTLVPWSWPIPHTSPQQYMDGYDNETKAVGEVLAQTVERALKWSSVWARSDDISFAREKFGLPLTNLLFLGVAPTGLFSTKPLCVAGQPVGPAPNGSTAGTEVCTEVAAYTIGDAEFLGVPGEVFPYVIIRGFQGPQDMPFPGEAMSPWVMPHASKPFRFIEGLGEDMDGYMFSQNNATAVPEVDPQRGAYLPADDHFGCSHDDDSEAASGNAGTVMANHLIHVLSLVGTDAHQRVAQGRYVLSDGRLSRNPIGTGPLRCDGGADMFTLDAGGGARAIWLKAPDGTTRAVMPGGFIDSGGRPQARPNMSTRGIWVASRGERRFTEGVSERVWLDVFADIPGAPDKVAPPPA